MRTTFSDPRRASFDVEEAIAQMQSCGVVGRTEELRKLLIAWKLGRHVLVEGEVGVGKTTLAQAVSCFFGTTFVRVDGSEDLLPHALVGYFDPPTVIRDGYVEEAFVEGALAKAMREGGCLFVNEINRMPENTQNLLLTALDEGTLDRPRLEPVRAADGFWVVATQNPEAHIGVTALGEALKDRFAWVKLDHQSEAEEVQIVTQAAGLEPKQLDVARLAVAMVRASRVHPDLRRGASVRGAIDLALFVTEFLSNGIETRRAWEEAAITSLATKVELEDGVTRTREEVLSELVRATLSSDPRQWASRRDPAAMNPSTDRIG
ncbi:MAG: MoxR family ATPase [Promethearchaeota archaeon]